jgi:hypothetical protein
MSSLGKHLEPFGLIIGNVRGSSTRLVMPFAIKCIIND